ncbi:hypothetical protein AB4Y36_38355, partial [Paraburkholderia sp. BR10936]|uniref:hypothetical protein n=1 Tax=Paraburkholderia sp. BR10936 TaxID=3236993 RepID=UPI0034D20607
RSRVTPFVEFVLNYMDLLPRASGVEILINTDYDFDPQLFVTIHRIINVTLPDAFQRVQDHINANLPIIAP